MMPEDQTEDMWTPYKELLKSIEFNLTRELQVPSSEFEILLKKFKQNFFNLLQNPPKNAKTREELRKGMSEGISVRGIGHQILSKELYQEVIIISDMYDLNEYMALDLLCTAQIQLPYHSGLARGLVAVLLYYDGRKALVQSLRQLVQARQGVLWRLDISEGVSKFVTEYTDDLMENGVFNRILDLLKSLDIVKETELLQHNRALGNPKHHRQVLDLFEEIRQQLADIVYIWAAQTGLPRGPIFSLINHLKTLKIEEDASGGIDNISLTLQMALLYGLDLSILHVREDGEEIVNSLPLIAEEGLMKALLDELSPAKGKWECEGLHALSMLALGECLATVRLLPVNQSLQLASEHEEDADVAILMNVFEFIYKVVLKNNMIYTERFYYHRMHNILTDFIVLMQPKVKDLRIRADEAARTLLAYTQEGLEAPTNLPRQFEHFLYCIATLYNKDPLKLELCLEYWCPSELTLTQTPSYRTPPRSVSLFKFVRMAGDMMPPSLFVPYLNMLSSLSSSSQTARYCFNLLKQNGAGYATTISWDHFFGTLMRYMSNLRQETPPVTDTVYRHRNYHRGITPQEIQGLHAVLQIIRTVADNDDFSRIALCEHPAWAPLTILLGLVSCSVPMPLKAALLSTLASLSKSPETAAQMWNNLEASQILVTVPSTSSYQPRGIQTELEELESRNEEYPLTRSLLELLDVLTDAGIPRTLGAGPRKPGFDPYLTFIVNSVFLKFHTRAYKNPDEKWLVAKMSLKMLEKFLIQYDPQPSDFPVGNQTSEFNPPPGFHLMIQMNTKSQFLDLILYIIDESSNLFDTHSTFSGKEHIEECTLNCLTILNRALVLQTKFHTLLSNSSCTILLTSLSKLLLSINPRTSRPDFIIKICKFVGYQSFLPKQAFVATKVLAQVIQQPSIHSQIMTILLSNLDIELEIKAGFISCLDADNDWKEMGEEEEATLTATKEAVINLLKQCLSHTAPNLTHYLCGFDVKRDVSKTVFQFPGVCGAPRTCLHALFTLLNLSVNKLGIKFKPTLIESAYGLLHALCDNPKTYGPVLKFIKQNQDFFHRHVSAITPSQNFSTSEMNKISWLLKTIAIEQKICSAGNQIFYLKHLTKLLVGFPHVIESKDSIDKLETRQSHVNGERPSQGNFLKELIVSFDFNVDVVATPQWDYFDNSIMEKLIINCEMSQNPRLINVKKLHQVLIDELTTLQGTAAASQRQLILQEIRKVLTYAIKVNDIRQKEAATVRFMDSWRQLIQVIFVTLPADVMNLDEQQRLLLELLETLLNKMLGCQALPEVGTLASGAILLLMDCLHKSHVNSLKRKQVLAPDDSERLFVQNIIHSNESSLKFILHNVLQWIIVSGVSSQRLRVNLYGTLLTYLHMISVGYEQKLVSNQSSFYVSRLDNPNNQMLYDDRILIPADILSDFGDKLVEVLCHDCIAGHDVCKMLAMCSLNRFIMLSMQENWITYLSVKGFLKHLIDSLLNSDSELKDMLETVPESIRSIYLYETKMSLMVRIATIRTGAEVLLEQRLLPCLASMKVFDDHPKVERQVGNVLEDFVPSIESRYQQILFPALDLCDAVLTSLGTDNRAAVAQVMYFLLSHLEVVENVLQQGRPNIPAQFLKELALITGLIARTANNDICSILESHDASPNDRAYLHRLQKYMLALLPRFVLSEAVVKELSSGAGGDKAEIRQGSERLLYSMQVASNLALYARNITANHGIEHGSAAVIFHPNLTDPLAVSLGGRYQYSHYSEQNPNIGVIVQQLVNCVHYYHNEKVTLDFLTGKVSQVSKMNSIDLKEFVQAPTRTFNIYVIREGALQNLTDRLKSKQKELEYTAFLIENCLYLIWAHLDYYMLKAIPKTKNYGFGTTNETVTGTLLPPVEATWKVTADDISHLKQGLVSIFNDIFSRKLVETTQDRPELDKGFVEALLRRLKRLIQFVPVK